MSALRSSKKKGRSMQFRDLGRQYEALKLPIDAAVREILTGANFISGVQVAELERQLADYVGVKHCITCGNGTDALTLALMVWGIGKGDAVFVPDFTFFSSGECPAYAGATPVFVDIYEDTFNMSAESLEDAIIKVKKEGKLIPKVIVPVDLFGLTADYGKLRPIAKKYGMKILEDGAQGFGGELCGKKACSFGDISTTSFFPAKPLGCYGDGGALFTDNDADAELLRSFRVHGKGENKYDNVRLGMNSRLDTLQAAILQVKLNAFIDYERKNVNEIATRYTKLLKGIVKTSSVYDGFLSSWAQYSILLDDSMMRNDLQKYLKEKGIPSMVYYPKPMHRQTAFSGGRCVYTDLSVTESVCERVLSLPMHPYLTVEEQDAVVEAIKAFVSKL